MVEPSQPTPLLASGWNVMAENCNRLIFKFGRLIEGRAEGRFAISAIVVLILASLLTLLISENAASVQFWPATVTDSPVAPSGEGLC